jgi:hypothetical protein
MTIITAVDTLGIRFRVSSALDVAASRPGQDGLGASIAEHMRQSSAVTS